MSALEEAAIFRPEALPFGQVDQRTLELLQRRSSRAGGHSRGWLVRRALLAADLIGLVVAFTAALALTGFNGDPSDRHDVLHELIVFAATLPGWVVTSKLLGLYDQDEERTEHSTIDELAGVLQLVTLGTWLVYASSWATSLADPGAERMVTFWLLAIGFVAAGRASARGLCRQSVSYVQNTVIVGAGAIGQLVARKLTQHPEYGINLVGFVDREPMAMRTELDDVPLLGPPEILPDIVRVLDIERVVVAFSGDSHEQTLWLIHALQEFDIQVDLVPRLFESIGPHVGVHTVEGLPLVGLAPRRPARSSRLVKRAVDIVGSSVLLVIAAPLFAVIAFRIKRDSAGPVFFRQQRLGLDKHAFTVLKFRTMRVDTDESVHRDYVKAIMSTDAAPQGNGLYKLERGDAITPVGHWLRRTSLDELPQLINVLRGDMSLVGPRPCMLYETEHFEPHHFERFLVPAGMTGLWQVTARAHSTFREALDMDVSYVRGWSVGLDLRLLFRTPLQILKRPGTA